MVDPAPEQQVMSAREFQRAVQAALDVPLEFNPAGSPTHCHCQFGAKYGPVITRRTQSSTHAVTLTAGVVRDAAVVEQAAADTDLAFAARGGDRSRWIQPHLGDRGASRALSDAFFTVTRQGLQRTRSSGDRVAWPIPRR